MDNKNTRKTDRQKQLLDIALELFATQGYDQTKISDIVNKANVSQGTFYWYFKSKEMIATEMFTQGRLALIETISTGYRIEKGSTSESFESSKQLFYKLFQFAKKNHFFMKILLKGIHSQPALQVQVDTIKNDMKKAFAKNIRRASDFEMIPRSVDPDLQAVFVMSLIEGTLSSWLFQSKDEEWQQIEIEELVEKTVQFEFFGLFGV